MSEEQKYFLANLKIIMSPQEKQGKNLHITNYLDKLSIPYEKLYAPRHLKQGDYSFVIDGKDYRDLFFNRTQIWIGRSLYVFGTREQKHESQSQKAKQPCDTIGVDNIRDNLEFEFIRMIEIGVKEKWLFVENSAPFEQIKSYANGYEKKKKTKQQGSISMRHYLVGVASNRYDFKILCFPNKDDFSKIMINKMYYFWRNEMKIQYGAGFLPKLKLINKKLISLDKGIYILVVFY